MPAPPTPPVTVDIIIEIDGGDGIVLIERAHEPLGPALPGGFVDPGETVWQAAIREAKEETGLDITLRHQFFTYSDPRRDPRGPTVAVVFIAEADGEPQGGDDAAAARVCPIDALPPILCFDHRQILDDYLIFKRSGRRPPPQR